MINEKIIFFRTKSSPAFERAQNESNWENFSLNIR